MSGSYTVEMGDRGRFVVPKELRDRIGLREGTRLVLLDSPDGVVLATREQVKTLLRRQLAGGSLVDELIADRRRAAVGEDE